MFDLSLPIDFISTIDVRIDVPSLGKKGPTIRQLN